MTIIEQIIANHSNRAQLNPGDIVDIAIDARVARDFGGSKVVKTIRENGLTVDDPTRTYFTFDCNTASLGSKFSEAQHICRSFARANGIKVFDIDYGIGTHAMIQEGIAWPGSVAVTTGKHANILGAIGALGLALDPDDVASAWANGKIWMRVPETIKINLNGDWPEEIRAKDMVLNLLDGFGENDLVGYAIEIAGDAVSRLTLDERVTLTSLAIEMGCVAVLIEPNTWVIDFCEERVQNNFDAVRATPDAKYAYEYNFDLGDFKPRVSKSGLLKANVPVNEVKGTKISFATVGSCVNGRIQDMRAVANVLEGKQVAPGVVLKIVPATNEVWAQCLDEGLVQIFKNAGAIFANPGCVSCEGCSTPTVIETESNEITISTGNRNHYRNKHQKNLFIASPAIVAASAIAGVITTPEEIPDEPVLFEQFIQANGDPVKIKMETPTENKPLLIEGKARIIALDDVSTDMLINSKHEALGSGAEKHAFKSLKGYENLTEIIEAGDILIVQKNFGLGKAKSQVIDIFKKLEIGAVLAESVAYDLERKIINAGIPLLSYKESMKTNNGDHLRINLESGEIKNLSQNIIYTIQALSEIQLDLYKKGSLH